VTSGRKRGIVVIALATAGAAGAYGAGRAVVQHRPLYTGVSILVFGLVAALSVFAVAWFQRRLRRAAAVVGGQLDNMTSSGQLGMVMVSRADGLSDIIRPLNRMLIHCHKEVQQFQAANRELRIQACISDAERQRTEAIILSIRDVVIVCNWFDELILANQAAEKLFGFTRHGAEGKNIDQVIDNGVLIRLIRETRGNADTTPRHMLEHTIDANGEARTFEVTLSCVKTVDGDVSSVVAVLHDITREKEIAQMKTDFVSHVSHELRTPLAGIKAYVEMLLDGDADDPATQREFHQAIAGETERLGRMIDNILNISRIESGAAKAVFEPLELTGVVKEALEIAAPQAHAKNIELVEDLGPIFKQAEADRDLVVQAVMNLVGNAIKYTPPGGTVTVSTLVDERRGFVICQVKDNGVGISGDDLPHVFDKFYRIRSTRKLAKGTGLGLSLVKHIVETVHHGHLTVESALGKGSTFRMQLPIIP